MAKIALGTWAWGAGAFGGDKVFGSKTDVENLKPVFDAAKIMGSVLVIIFQFLYNPKVDSRFALLP